MTNRNILYVDCETTALDGEVIEAGVLLVDEYDNFITSHTNYFKPLHPISFGSMAIHNITPEMVEGKEHWEQAKGEYLIDAEYLVAHNAKFDTEIMGVPDGKYKVLCTLTLARKLKLDEKVDSLKNMALFYYYGGHNKTQFEGSSHSALYDCHVTRFILKEILNEFSLTIDQAYDLIAEDYNSFTCGFAKHKGKLWEDVVKTDRQYVLWLLDNNKIVSKVDLKKVKAML